LLDASLDGPPTAIDDLDADAFEAELDRRHEEGLRAPSVLVPMDEMFERLERRARCE
jgi:hypothetical protein